MLFVRIVFFLLLVFTYNFLFFPYVITGLLLPYKENSLEELLVEKIRKSESYTFLQSDELNNNKDDKSTLNTLKKIFNSLSIVFSLLFSFVITLSICITLFSETYTSSLLILNRFDFFS